MGIQGEESRREGCAIEQIGVYFNQAVAMFNGADLEGALLAFSRIRPEHGHFHFRAQAYIGQIFLRKGDHAQAEGYLLTATRNLRDPEITYKYAEFLFAQRRFDEAEAAYRRVLTYKAAMPDAHTRLGMIHRHRGATQEAIRAFEQALMLDPRAMVARFMLAQICAGQGDHVRALNQLHMVLHAQPEFAPARLLQAEIFQQLGDHRQALVEFDRYLKVNPRDATAYMKLAVSFQAVEDLKQAALAFERAYGLNRELVSALASAALLREKAHQYNRASEHYRKLSPHVQYGAIAQAALKRLTDAGLLAQPDPADDVAQDFEVPKAHGRLSGLPSRPPSRFSKTDTEHAAGVRIVTDVLSGAHGGRTAPLQAMGTRRLPERGPETAPLLPGDKSTIETNAFDEALRAVGKSLKSTLRAKLRSWLSEDP